MALKKICQVCMLSILVIIILPSYAQPENPFGQTFQINTHLRSFIGKPAWTIIIRDEETGQVIPYLFDFETEDNFWVGFTYGKAYRITVSRLQFGPPDCTINNFCHLQDGIINGESFIISLSGDLTPDRYTSVCHVLRYKNLPFPIAKPEPEVSVETTTEGGAEVPSQVETVVETVKNVAAPALSNLTK